MGNGYAAALACNVLRFHLVLLMRVAFGRHKYSFNEGGQGGKGFALPPYPTIITSTSGSSATFVAFGSVTFIRNLAEEHMSFSSS
jgi:hypothetical protein